MPGAHPIDADTAASTGATAGATAAPASRCSLSQQHCPESNLLIVNVDSSGRASELQVVKHVRRNTFNCLSATAPHDDH